MRSNDEPFQILRHGLPDGLRPDSSSDIPSTAPFLVDNRLDPRTVISREKLLPDRKDCFERDRILYRWF